MYFNCTIGGSFGDCMVAVLVGDHTRHWRKVSERVSRRLHILEAVLEGKITTRKLEQVVVVAAFDIHRACYGRGGWYRVRWVAPFIDGVWFAMVFGRLYYPGVCKSEEVVVSVGRRGYIPLLAKERRGWS